MKKFSGYDPAIKAEKSILEMSLENARKPHFSTTNGISWNGQSCGTAKYELINNHRQNVNY